ncbi:hypothetical protein PTTW11_04339 [Pyrenophora teres f. teres]|uniref:Uncharacterized protein n=1 Tax=Pyrenophora teres f. teres TaxID=97479 RepID=A0A6S6VYX8_9PLEO|nr:hypothetical protein HRS9122_01176 [Pyrenophora teres f. teres]CAE7027977.1 hypothetical protein PTTW11_04339 [Pyrenophora teres f. teres]
MSGTVASNDMANESPMSAKAGDVSTSLSEDSIDTETSDKPNSLSGTVAGTESSDKPGSQSEDRSKSLSLADVDTGTSNILEGSMERLSLGSENKSTAPPDLDAVTEKLIGLPNEIIKRYYGDRIRFLTDYAGIQHSLAWAVKIDDVIQPFTILFLVPPDGRLEIAKNDGDDIPVDDLSAHIVRTQKIQDLALEVQSVHGCKRVGFYDGNHFIWVTCNPQPGIGMEQVTLDGRPLVYTHGSEIFRSQLLLCLAEAIDGAGVTMLERLKGYTLAESGLQSLGLGVPPKKTDGNLDDSNLTRTRVTIGECAFNAYGRENGDILKVDDRPLPEIEDHLLTTSLDVRIAARRPLLDLLCVVGESWMGSELKYSYDAIPNALTWYMRSKDRTKLCVAILQIAPAGTVVEQDWGMIRADLTYDNNEGIVRTAEPLRDNLLVLGQEYKCPYMALFDYHNFVTVSRSWNAAFVSSLTFHKDGQIVSGAVEWLVTAFKSLE